MENDQSQSKHTVAILVIFETLKKEFKDKGSVICDAGKTRAHARHKNTRSVFKGRIPDLFVDFGDSLLVVEIGDTQAEKIIEYQQNDKIVEIRWYSKNCEIAGVWKKIDGTWINSSGGNVDVDSKIEITEILEKQIAILEKVLQTKKADFEQEYMRLDEKLAVKKKRLFTQNEKLDFRQSQLTKKKLELDKVENDLAIQQRKIQGQVSQVRKQDDRLAIIKTVFKESHPNGYEAA